MENRFVAEMVGTALLILFGDGVVAGVLLNRSKAQNGGWIVITMGWGLGVAVAVYAAGQFSGAHINPAVTLGLATIGELPWSDVPTYIGGQFVGAFIGAVLVWLAYLPHWEETDDPGLKLAVFSTGPAIRNYGMNLLTEIIGTAALVAGVLAIVANAAPGEVGLTPLLVGFLVVGIGLSLGGPTGYAINPARDLGPRIAHAVLPIAGKGDSDWGYAWIPVVGPVVGGVLGALLFKALWP
ncbi:MAG TPA: MIP/aquaporin family protein [Actinomycetota bacterium]|nr:MIP/aquaporin family protein [Actinomycetota bacterium]